MSQVSLARGLLRNSFRSSMLFAIGASREARRARHSGDPEGGRGGFDE